MAAETEPTVPLDPEADQESRVSPLELFFDLVFVLSFTQVTLTMAENPTWEGVGEVVRPSGSLVPGGEDARPVGGDGDRELEVGGEGVVG